MTCNQNTVAGSLGLLLAVGVWVVSNTFHSPMAEAGLGPAFYPKVLAVCLALASLVLIFGSVPVVERKGSRLSGLPFVRFVLLIVLLCFYAFTITRLGYFSSTIITSFLVTFVGYWEIDAKKILYACINTTLLCVTIYCIFKLLFKFALPQGILF